MKKKSAKKPSPESLVQSALEDLKARDIVVMNVRGISDMFDTLVVATGTSNRQVRALAEHVMEQMKKNGYPPSGNEGLDAGEWALVDFGDIVVHVMLPETRTFYDIEGLWHVPDTAAPAAEPTAAPAATRSGKPRSPRAKASPAGTQPAARPARKAAKATAAAPAAKPGTRRKAASTSEAAPAPRPRRTSAAKPATGGTASATGKARPASKSAPANRPATGAAGKARSGSKAGKAAPRAPTAGKPPRARRPKPATD